MNLTQRKIKHWTRLMLAVVLFAQGTLAAHACVSAPDTLLQRIATEAVVEVMPCHQVEDNNLNACQMHCTLAEQLNLDQQNPVAVAVAEVVLHIESPAMQHQYQTVISAPVALNTGPPLSIRFCSFLI